MTTAVVKGGRDSSFIKKIPTILTLSRLVVTPLFVSIYIAYAAFSIPIVVVPFVLLTLLLFCEITDILDGYLARKFHAVSELGKLLDPMADSIMRISIFIGFTQGPIALPIWPILLFLYRDVLVGTLRTLVALRGKTLAARGSGKIKAILQAIAVFVVLFLFAAYVLNQISLETLHDYSEIIIGAVSFYSIASGIEYFYAHRNDLKFFLGQL